MRNVCIVCLLTILTSIAYADTTCRCGKGLVSVGATKAKVLAICGKPVLEEKVSYNKKRDVADNGFSQKEVMVENLTYSTDDRVFHVLTFENGRLEKIETQFN